MTGNPSHIGTVNMDIAIKASPATVWEALTRRIGDWWPDDFYAGGEPGNRGFTLEAKAGGRMYETWEGGGGALWGTVVCVVPGKTLQVLGNQFPNWGGPTEWYGTWTLAKDGAGTCLAFSESAVGNVSEGALAEKQQGWKYLWATLKAYVEGKPAPAWSS